MDIDITSYREILDEFTKGDQILSEIGSCIAILGSARLSSENKYYQLAMEIAEKLPIWALVLLQEVDQA